MNVRKLLDWRKLLIYTHRWMGIFFGIVFIVWFVSGVVFMYVGMPHLSTRERLGHLKPLDLSTVTLSPADAAKKNELDPKRFRVEMFYDGRPIYRFGNTKVYADTGGLVDGANALQAVDIVKRWVPQYESTVRYDAYLEDSDQWTLQQAQRQFMPLHRISVGDPAGTNYYVSEDTGELVMKTDRRGRFWGFWSAVLHWTYFTPLRRHRPFWSALITWAGLIGAFMCLSGMVAGVWRFSPSARFRLKGVFCSASMQMATAMSLAIAPDCLPDLSTDIEANAFNVLNRAQFGAPVSTLTDVRFGQVLAIRGGTNPRQLQFGVKLTF